MILNHEDVTEQEARVRAIKLLEEVGIPSPEERVDNYPHNMSGGMRQRVMIAMSLACSPRLLLADEPTTALDVTIQAQILDLMNKLQEERNTAIVMITHDLGVVAETCDHVVVMYAGHVAENADVYSLLRIPVTLHHRTFQEYPRPRRGWWSTLYHRRHGAFRLQLPARMSLPRPLSICHRAVPHETRNGRSGSRSLRCLSQLARSQSLLCQRRRSN